jgi:hypothetical protein
MYIIFKKRIFSTIGFTQLENTDNYADEAKISLIPIISESLELFSSV